jgi:putative flippase GtrA
MRTVALHPVLARFFGFAAVGIFGTAAHYAVLWLLVERAGAAVVPATTAGFTTGAIVNYILNRRFVFDSVASHGTALPKFLTVAVCGAVINALAVAWLLAVTDAHYLLVQLTATATVLVWNFAANYLWTFRE